MRVEFQLGPDWDLRRMNTGELWIFHTTCRAEDFKKGWTEMDGTCSCGELIPKSVLNAALLAGANDARLFEESLF